MIMTKQERIVANLTKEEALLLREDLVCLMRILDGNITPEEFENFEVSPAGWEFVKKVDKELEIGTPGTEVTQDILNSEPKP